MGWTCMGCGHRAPLVPTKRPDGSTFTRCGCTACHGGPAPILYPLPPIVQET